MRLMFAKKSKELIKNSNSFILLGDISVGNFIEKGDDLYKNVINMGINEQAIITFGAGLSDLADNVVCHTISPFLIERAFEAIKVNCSYNKRKLILVSANGPYDYYKLGPTHHCVNDIDILSTLENIDLFCPFNDESFSAAYDLSVESKKASYIRVTNRTSNMELSLVDKKSLSYFKDNQSENLIITTGEGLLYSEKFYNINNEYDLLVKVRVDSDLIKTKKQYKQIIIIEPYLNKIFKVYKKNVKRFNFKKNSKRIIEENMGWSDFRND